MAVTTFEPKLKPTNADLQDQVAELHGCLDNVDRKATLALQHTVMTSQALGIKLPTDAETALDLPPMKINRRLGGLSPAQAAGWAVPIITFAMTLYKVIEPTVVAAITAAAPVLHHALMTFR